MKSKTKIILYSIGSFILFWIFIFNFTQMKYCTWPLDATNSNSDSIEESRQLGVFKAEFKSKYSYYIFFNDTMKVKEAWIEEDWFSGFFSNRVSPRMKTKEFNYGKDSIMMFHVLFETINSKSIIDSLKIKNTLENHGKEGRFYIKGNKFILDYPFKKLNDTFIIEIFKGVPFNKEKLTVNEYFKKSYKNKIGEMTFYKVK